MSRITGTSDELVAFAKRAKARDRLLWILAAGWMVILILFAIYFGNRAKHAEDMLQRVDKATYPQLVRQKNSVFPFLGTAPTVAGLDPSSDIKKFERGNRDAAHNDNTRYFDCDRDPTEDVDPRAVITGGFVVTRANFQDLTAFHDISITPLADGKFRMWIERATNTPSDAFVRMDIYLLYKSPVVPN